MGLKVALAGAIALVLQTIGVTWKAQDWRYGKELASQAAILAQDAAKAERSAREEERRRYSALEKVRNDAREQNRAAAGYAVAADAAGNRLHFTATELTARSSGSTPDPVAAQRGASATSAPMVLSELFRRADRRAGELAAAYDRARIAGLACEASYNALIN